MKLTNLSISLLVLLALFAQAYAVNPKPNLKKTTVETNVLKPAPKILGYDKLSTGDLARLQVPVVAAATEKENAKAAESWEISPKRPVSGNLELISFNGAYSANYWIISSVPRIEGPDLTGYYSSWMQLKFKEVKGKEYRMKIKLNGSGYRNQHLYVGTPGNSLGSYPIDAGGIVNVIWTSDSASSGSAVNNPAIGQLVGGSARVAAPPTYIQKITIDEL